MACKNLSDGKVTLFVCDGAGPRISIPPQKQIKLPKKPKRQAVRQ